MAKTSRAAVEKLQQSKSFRTVPTSQRSQFWIAWKRYGGFEAQVDKDQAHISVGLRDEQMSQLFSEDQQTTKSQAVGLTGFAERAKQREPEGDLDGDQADQIGDGGSRKRHPLAKPGGGPTRAAYRAILRLDSRPLTTILDLTREPDRTVPHGEKTLVCEPYALWSL